MKLPTPGSQAAGACCRWRDFYDSFREQYLLWMGVPPTDEVWAAAIKDWRKANTGWEAAHNARRRARLAVERANAKPLVHLGGKNYAEEGSALALKYGKRATQPKDTPNV